MLDDIEFLDDATRPTAPKLDGLTPRQREAGQHLKEIHDHLRQNMKTLRVLIERASAGKVSPAEIAQTAGELEMLANYRRFGNLCGQHCAIVDQHHSIEDYALFPALATKSEALRKVTQRLAAEHVVVHELLVREMDAITALAEAPSRESFEQAKTIYEALERVLLSHLGYEEEQIGDAIGYYGVF
jgi:hemerythrin-like domain-containing protein